MYEDYRPVPSRVAQLPGREQASGRRVSWPDLLPHWRLIVSDLAHLYGVDLTDPAVWLRPWPPVRSLILGLPGEKSSRLRHALGGD
ncbi:hypothetical protein UQW22_09870 [Isoptericola halotolerans]|uniref:hypothetical protein n=1 Tax=Isoptericola halotolerans TaxID=300560 RepID=UPI0038910E84